MRVPEPPPDWTQQYNAPEIAGDYDHRYRGPIRRMNNDRIWRTVIQQLKMAAGGTIPQWVVDVPAGTGRYTDRLNALGCRVINLDLSHQMLSVLRSKHGSAFDVACDLHQSALSCPPGTVALSLRLMQHFDPEERIKALHSIRQIAPLAVVAYYPGWDYKNRLRRLRHQLHLPTRIVREHIPLQKIHAEASAAGWNLLSVRRVFPVLSENVLLTLQAR